MFEQMVELLKADNTIVVMDGYWCVCYIENLAQKNGIMLDYEDDYELIDALVEWLMD